MSVVVYTVFKVHYDRHLQGHNATASCQTLPSREDFQSLDIKLYDYFITH